jgi:hypothetical protein
MYIYYELYVSEFLYFNVIFLYVLYVSVTDTSEGARGEENVKVKFETLRAMEQAETIDIDSHMSDRVSIFSSAMINLSVIHC